MVIRTWPRRSISRPTCRLMSEETSARERANSGAIKASERFLRFDKRSSLRSDSAFKPLVLPKILIFASAAKQIIGVLKRVWPLYYEET